MITIFAHLKDINSNWSNKVALSISQHEYQALRDSNSSEFNTTEEKVCNTIKTSFENIIAYVPYWFVDHYSLA